VADASEVQARMTDKPILEEPYCYEMMSVVEYNQILSHLISTKVVQQKIIPTKYGFPSTEWIKNDKYLAFTNTDMTKEILRNI
jgi:hypothetical protein